MSSRGFNAGWLVGAVLLSSWAISSASDQAVRPPAPRPDARLPLPAVSADVEEQISRLSEWTQTVIAPTARRNPFQFEVRGSKFEVPQFDVRPSPGTSNEGTSNLSTSNLSTSNLELRTPNLKALVSQGGAMLAVVSFDDSLHYVKQGDIVAGRYRVDSVSADSVEVFDLTLGTILKLTLQSLT